MSDLFRVSRLLLLAAAPVLLAAAFCGCSSSAKIEVPILVQELPPNPPGASVDLYWNPRSYEEWLQLPSEPEKAPDLAAANIRDSHSLWENKKDGRKHGKVADVVASGQINLKHPRDWLLLDLGQGARELGADAVVINSLEVRALAGFAQPDDTDALWKGGMTVKVWVYAQAIRYE